MKPSRTLTTLTVLILILALVAAGAGVFLQGAAKPVPFQTARGEAVELRGSGLYRYDSVSMATQGIAQDVVTLFFGLPLLLAALLLYRQGRVSGKLLLAGTLGYFLYTYASYAFGAAYNPLFLVYVALFSLCLFATILAIASIDLQTLPLHFSDKLPRRGIAAISFAIGGFLFLAWLGRIVPPLLQGQPPIGLESYTTLVIQALDLGLIVPLAFLSGILLLQRKPLGYLLASITMIKGLTMGVALIAMIIGMLLAGVPVSPVEMIMFPLLLLIVIGMAVALLKNVIENPGG